MIINDNGFDKTTPCDIYLCPPNQHRTCCLNGIKENTVSITENLKDYDTLSFDLDKYITDSEGNPCLSNGYDKIDYLMDIDVDGIGRFVVSAPHRFRQTDIPRQKPFSVPLLNGDYRALILRI